MTDDQYTKLFQRIEDGFRTVNTQLDNMATKTQVEAVYDLLDKNISEHERQELERAAMAAHLERLERWVKEVADKTGVKLTSA